MNSWYNKGTTTKVRLVEKAKPQTIAVATGPQIRDFPPNPVVRENKPATVVKDVMRIGTTRRRAA